MNNNNLISWLAGLIALAVIITIVVFTTNAAVGQEARVLMQTDIQAEIAAPNLPKPEVRTLSVVRFSSGDIAKIEVDGTKCIFVETRDGVALSCDWR